MEPDFHIRKITLSGNGCPFVLVRGSYYINTVLPVVDRLELRCALRGIFADIGVKQIVFVGVK